MRAASGRTSWRRQPSTALPLPTTSASRACSSCRHARRRRVVARMPRVARRRDACSARGRRRGQRVHGRDPRAPAPGARRRARGRPRREPRGRGRPDRRDRAPARPGGRLPPAGARRRRPGAPTRSSACSRGRRGSKASSASGSSGRHRRLGPAEDPARGRAFDGLQSATPHPSAGRRARRGATTASSRSCLVSSAVMLVSREAWRRTGPFDERVAGHHNDLDFCWRARLAGFARADDPPCDRFVTATATFGGERGQDPRSRSTR